MVPRVWKRVSNRFIVRETALLLLGIVPLTIMARLSSSYLNETPVFDFVPADLWADFWSMITVLICGFLLLILTRISKFSRYLQGLLLILVSLVYVFSRKYFYVYKTEFFWSHLGHEKVEAGLWTSIRAEFDTWIVLGILFTIIYCLFFIYYSIQYSQHWQESQKGSYLYSLIYMSLLGLFLVLYLTSQRTSNIISQEQVEGNVVLNLFLFPLLPKPSPNLIDKNLNLIHKKEFRFQYPSNATTTTINKPPLPFRHKGKKLNIVLYFLESVSHKYIGKYDQNGISITPHWDSLSKKSFLFNNHYANNPLSINSLFNVLTSAYVMPSDIWVAKDYPDIKIDSLPEILKRNGYKNAVYHSGYFDYAGAGRFLKNRSFDSINDVTNLKTDEFDEINWGVDDRAFILPSINFAKKSLQKKHPFFTIYLPTSPHHPYETPNKTYPIKVPKSLAPGRGKMFRQYLNALHYSDKVLALTIDAYKKAGLMKNTVFFIFADHGEAFGQHRKNYNHPFYIYEENVHVPFMIYSPDIIPKQIQVDAVSRHIDIMPTVLDMLKIKAPPHIEGKSLLRSYAQQYAPLHTSWRNNLLGIRDGKYKYIYNQITQKEELYDLSQDAGEKVDISTKNPRITLALKKEIFLIKDHQKKFFEKVLSTKINWNKIQDKDKY